MRTGARIAIVLLAVATAAAIGFVAYQAGLDAGVATADSTEVVRVVSDGWRGGPGFFPGFLFFPFAFIGVILLLKFVFAPRHRGWGPPGPRHHDWEERAADWHARQHAMRRGDNASSTTTEGRREPDWPEDPA